MFSAGGDPPGRRSDGAGVADGAERLQLLEHRRGGRAPGPYRLQHLLSRAVWDEQQVLDAAAAWAVSHLDDRDAVLIVDETADEKSSADCGRRSSPVLRHRGRDRAVPGGGHLDLRHRARARADRPGSVAAQGCAAEEEHRSGGVPEEVPFATRPQLAGAGPADRAHAAGSAAPARHGRSRSLARLRDCGIRLTCAPEMGYVLAAARQPRPEERPRSGPGSSGLQYATTWNLRAQIIYGGRVRSPRYSRNRVREDLFDRSPLAQRGRRDLRVPHDLWVHMFSRYGQ